MEWSRQERIFDEDGIMLDKDRALLENEADINLRTEWESVNG